jgi:predicted phosphodiesterase
MTYLIFSDVHGNRFGLEAVLEHAHGEYDAVLCLGDVVGYGAHPNECCEIVRGLVAASAEGVCLMGNHDAAALGIIDASWFNHVAREAIEWTAENLTESNRTWLQSLSPTHTTEKFQAVHGSLRGPLEEYITSDEIAVGTMEEMTAPLCFYGHTHVAEAWTVRERKRGLLRRVRSHLTRHKMRDGGRVTFRNGAWCLLNPGSCGQPRDGNRQARYALWNPRYDVVDIFAIDYDWQAARMAILNAGLPHLLGDRLGMGR